MSHPSATAIENVNNNGTKIAFCRLQVPKDAILLQQIAPKWAVNEENLLPLQLSIHKN